MVRWVLYILGGVALIVVFVAIAEGLFDARSDREPSRALASSPSVAVESAPAPAPPATPRDELVALMNAEVEMLAAGREMSKLRASKRKADHARCTELAGDHEATVQAIYDKANDLPEDDAALTVVAQHLSFCVGCSSEADSQCDQASWLLQAFADERGITRKKKDSPR